MEKKKASPFGIKQRFPIACCNLLTQSKAVCLHTEKEKKRSWCIEINIYRSGRVFSGRSDLSREQLKSVPGCVVSIPECFLSPRFLFTSNCSQLIVSWKHFGVAWNSANNLIARVFSPGPFLLSFFFIFICTALSGPEQCGLFSFGGEEGLFHEKTSKYRIEWRTGKKLWFGNGRFICYL